MLHASTLLVLVSNLLLRVSPQVKLLPVHGLHHHQEHSSCHIHNAVDLFTENMAKVPPDPLLELQHVDPKAPLSTPDLVRLLISNCHDVCNTTVNTKIDEVVKIERGHVNNKLENVAATLTGGFTSLADVINKDNATKSDHLAERLDAMEDEMRRHDATHAENLADLNLKLNTFSIYHEKLLQNFKSGLQDALFIIERDMKTIWSKLANCQTCGYKSECSISQSQHVPESHGESPIHLPHSPPLENQQRSCILMQCSHQPDSQHHNPAGTDVTRNTLMNSSIEPSQCYRCNLCGFYFQSNDVLSLHMRCHHNSPMSSCCQCENSFQDTLLLADHVKQHHSEVDIPQPSTGTALMSASHPMRTFQCVVCDQAFENAEELKHHLTSSHPCNEPSECDNCGRVFSSNNLLVEHMKTCTPLQTSVLSSAVTLSCYSCNTVFGDVITLETHIQDYHPATHVFSCNICGITLDSPYLLTMHMKIYHAFGLPEAEVHCNYCEFTSPSMCLLNTHVRDNHEANHSISNIYGITPDITDENSIALLGQEHSIPQYDGPDDSTMTDISDTGGFSAASSKALGACAQDLTYNYSLNNQNQTRRLLTSALKQPLSITFNDFKILDNIRYAFNVNVECSSGVYLTAIKPVLETVTTDWTAEVGDFFLACSKVSNRQDNTGNHLLCTVLGLTITAKDQQDSLLHRTTLHFYHTRDKIQVQGSSVISPGVSSATWLVKHLIEPLAARHIATNQNAIDQVNSAILSSVSSGNWCCHYCHSNIEPTSQGTTAYL